MLDCGPPHYQFEDTRYTKRTHAFQPVVLVEQLIFPGLQEVLKLHLWNYLYEDL